MSNNPPHVVIVGAGFGGLSAAKALRGAELRLTVVDRTNHHLFQPLLYQVATAALTPSHIAAPIRGILRRQNNVTVLMGEVVGLDKKTRSLCVEVANRSITIDYDYLILATGARPSYFGHPEYAAFAPSLKTLADAVAIRNNILRALEFAEAEPNDPRRSAWLTFVLVGAGATGVEMAGAIASARKLIGSVFRYIDARRMRVVLIDQSPRVLPAFAESVSRQANQRLVKLGVDVRLGLRVEQVDADGVIAGGERIESKTVIWTAGVAPSPLAQWMHSDADRAGRIRVQPDCTLPGNPEIFLIGDVSTLMQDGKPLPGVAQTAIQQGRYAAKVIRRRIAGSPAPPPFHYFDKGSMAVIGKNFAVLQRGHLHLRGFMAWLAWSTVHLVSLATPGLRIMVFVQWLWTYLTNQPGSGLIIDHRVSSPGKSEAELTRSEESLKF